MTLLGAEAAHAARRVALAIVHLGAAATLVACGSASVRDLPPPAGPDRAPAPSAAPLGNVARITPGAAERAARPTRSADLRDGSLRVVLEPRARTLRLDDVLGGETRDRIPVGVGPTQVGCTPDGPCYVTDTTGDALLVIRVAADGGSMRLSRRTYVAGAPYALAVDRVRKRIWVTLTARDEVIELAAHAQPHILRRHPTVQQPDGVRVDEVSGDVLVTGTRPPRRQRLTDPSTPDRP